MSDISGKSQDKDFLCSSSKDPSKVNFGSSNNIGVSERKRKYKS